MSPSPYLAVSFRPVAGSRSSSSRTPRVQWRDVAGRVLLILALAGLGGGSGSCRYPAQPDVTQTFPVFDGMLTSGFDLGINTDAGLSDWVTAAGGELRMAYPPGQRWGAVFVVAGTSMRAPRPTLDFSGFRYLVVEMRSLRGNQIVWFDIKDVSHADTAAVQSVPLALTPGWQTIPVDLSTFNAVDRRHLYIVAEFRFEGEAAATVSCRQIYYSP